MEETSKNTIIITIKCDMSMVRILPKIYAARCGHQSIVHLLRPHGCVQPDTFTRKDAERSNGKAQQVGMH